MKSPAISFYFDDHYIAQPERFRKAMREVAGAGFKTVVTFHRESSFSLEDAKFIRSVRIACKEAARNGLDLLLPIQPELGHDFGSIVVREHPEIAHVQLVRGTGTIINKRFSIRFDEPLTIYGYWPSFIGVQVAFLRDQSGIKQLETLDYYADFFYDAYGDSLQNEREYLPYRPINGKMVWCLEGETDLSGELIVYAGFRLWQQADAASEWYDQELERILNLYKDMPAKGVVWDEPLKQTGEWGSSYKAGPGFLRLFTKMHGYDLMREIYLLDEEGDPQRTAVVRHDYYATMTETLRGLQSRFFDKVRQAFGQDVSLGTHHTWTGEGTSWDFRAGCFDYFTLTQLMTAGFVDAYWWDPRMVAYTLTLTHSLGKAYHDGKAFSNCYNWGTTRREQDFQTRLMALYQVDWFAMNYGDECELPNCYPLGRQWQGQVDGAARLCQVSEFLDGAQNRPEVAIWHGWEGVARMNDDGMALFWKTFVINTSFSFQERNVPFDFVSSDILIEGEITTGLWKTRMGAYRTVIFGYAVMLPEALLSKAEAFAAQGGTLIFLGPPPTCTTTGEDISNRFAKWIGIAPISFVDYLSLVHKQLIPPGKPINAMELVVYERPTRIDFQYPVDTEQSDRLVDIEGDIYGVKAHDQQVYYLTGLDPQEKLVDLVETRHSVEKELVVNLADAYWRSYQGAEGELYLLAMAKSRHVMHGGFQVGGDVYQVTGSGMILVRFQDKQFDSALGEDLKTFTRNSLPDGYQPLSAGPTVKRKQWHLPKDPMSTSLIKDD